MSLPTSYQPLVNVGLQVTCAPTEEEAKFVGSSRNLNKIISRLGLSTQGLIPPEEATDWPLDNHAKKIHGTINTEQY
ncbi:MAG: hypothetical protein CM1200mP3_00670 [Chloroflexota bacterium]|nr:MAG: hypothetical protein CM1200mP3_00670 [Chloroflexota bacterium]